ncbi:MAG: hypothetical protein HQL12_09625 [Candidatus Omnitrophica bacterium]|nr:hypothetical protein [Candidatus Omnitrophota bacterium]
MKNQKSNTKMNKESVEMAQLALMAQAHAFVLSELESVTKSLDEYNRDYPIKAPGCPYISRICVIRDGLTAIKAARVRCLRNFFDICAGREDQVIIKNETSFIKEMGYRPLKMNVATINYIAVYKRTVKWIRNKIKLG